VDFLRRTLFQCHENSEVYIHKDADISIESGINNFSLVNRKLDFVLGPMTIFVSQVSEIGYRYLECYANRHVTHVKIFRILYNRPIFDNFKCMLHKTWAYLEGLRVQIL